MNNPHQKPTSIRLGKLKPIYQSEAVRLDRSMHSLIISMLRQPEFVKKHLQELEKSKSTKK